MKKKGQRLGGLLAMMFLSATVFAEKVVFPTPVEHCVAWKARKKMFLVSSSEPIGMNCKIESKLVTQPDGLVQAEIVAPIKSFDSDDKGRDEYVFEALKGNIQPSLVLRTKPSTLSDLEKLWSAKTGTLAGEIEIGKKTYPLRIPYTTSVIGGVSMFRGKIVTTFAQLGLEAPKMAGGVVASVDDALELHYQLRRDRF